MLLFTFFSNLYYPDDIHSELYLLFFLLTSQMLIVYRTFKQIHNCGNGCVFGGVIMIFYVFDCF